MRIAAAERTERGLVDRTLGDDREQPFPPDLAVGEEHVFLGGEVAEEGAGRDLAGLGDLLDRRTVEALPGEPLHRGILQRLAGARLLALTEPHDGGHGNILTHHDAWQQVKFVKLRKLSVAARM